MSEEELISVLKDIYKFFEIDKLYEFKYKGQDKKGKNKFKIKYTEKGNPYIMIERTIIEN